MIIPVNIELTDDQIDDIVASGLKRLIVSHKEFHDENGFSVGAKEDLAHIIKTLTFYTLKEEFVDFCNDIKIDHTLYRKL